MAIVKWNPWGRDVSALQRNMNRFFDEFFIRREDEGSEFSGWNPAVDIYDNENDIVIKAELPGIDKKNVTIDLKDRMLTIKGERTAYSEVNEDKFYRRERSFGKFYRTFSLPLDVDANKIKADFKDGILTVNIQKPEQKQPRQISIN